MERSADSADDESMDVCSPKRRKVLRSGWWMNAEQTVQVGPAGIVWFRMPLQGSVPRLRGQWVGYHWEMDGTGAWCPTWFTYGLKFPNWQPDNVNLEDEPMRHCWAVVKRFAACLTWSEP